MAKPFHLEELLLRLKRITKRGTTDTVINAGPVRIDQLAHRVWVRDDEVILTVTEFNLLTMLASQPGRVYTHTELLQQVWGLNHDPGTNRVAVYIRHLRMKIGEGLVHTIRGRGYTFDQDR
jgi:two-component system response regulator QseB